MTQEQPSNDLLRRLPLFVGMPCLFIGIAEWVNTGDLTGKVLVGVGAALLVLAARLGAFKN